MPIEIVLPEPHDAQRRILDERERFNVLACGRRWGKTHLCTYLALQPALSGFPVGWFAPTYKVLSDATRTIWERLRPIHGRCRFDRSEMRLELPGGGSIEFWSTEPRHAGDQDSEVARSRKYKRIIYDEAARAKRLEADWTKAIRPTLADLRGDAWFPSTPKGHNYFRRLFVRGQGEQDWKSWQMPTSSNPYIHPKEVEAARRELPADAFSQEYLAEFLADAANPFGLNAIAQCVVPMEPGDVAVWGVDLAKSMDWTVAIGLNDAGRVCAFQRWQGDWRNTTTRLMGMIGDTPALIDSTGVGDPIVEQIQSRCPLVEGFKFTAQSKQQLFEGLAVAIQRGEIGFPDGIIRHELEVFQYEYTSTGVRYTAPDGEHDDCADALGLAWRCFQMMPAAPVLDAGPAVNGRSVDLWDEDQWT